MNQSIDNAVAALILAVDRSPKAELHIGQRYLTVDYNDAGAPEALSCFSYKSDVGDLQMHWEITFSNDGLPQRAATTEGEIIDDEKLQDMLHFYLGEIEDTAVAT